MTVLIGERLPPEEFVAGYIFKCNNTTMPICLERMVFRLLEPYLDSVKEISPGIPLFLLNFNTGRLYGLFEAADCGGYNLDPKFCPDIQNPGRSSYPAQVRVKLVTEYEPLPVDVTKGILKELRVTKEKFGFELSKPEPISITNAFKENQNQREADVDI